MNIMLFLASLTEFGFRLTGLGRIGVGHMGFGPSILF